MEKKFNRTQKCLLAVYMIKIVMDLFTQTFLTSHILAVSPDDVFGKGLMNVGLLSLSQAAAYLISYAVLSGFVDRSNRVSFLRVGIVINMVLLVALVFWGEVISSWVVLAGVICGLDSFFYSSYHVMKTELNSRASVKNYNLFATVLSNLVKVVVPTILGFVIDASSFSSVAIYVVVIAAVQFAISFGIKSHRPENSKFELGEYLKYLKENKDIGKKASYTYLNSAIAGFKYTYSTIVVILTVYTFKTNLSLGLFTSVFSLATILILMLYKKFDKAPRFNKFAVYMIIGFVPFISCIALVIWLNKVTLIIFNFTLIVTTYFSDYVGGAERDFIIKHMGHYEYVAEHNMLVETVLTSFKVIAYGIFLIVGLFANITAFKVLLIVFTVLNPIKYHVMYKQRLIRKQLEDERAEQDRLKQMAEASAISEQNS